MIKFHQNHHKDKKYPEKSAVDKNHDKYPQIMNIPKYIL